MKEDVFKRALGILLAFLMLFSAVPANAFVTPVNAAGITNGLCEHHVTHEDCGFVEAVEGQPCAHAGAHDESCGYREARSCTHVHNDTCGYVEAVAGSPCTYQCEICAQQQNAQNLCTHGNAPDACEACASDARVASVQKLIDALPETVTEETAARSALSAVDTAKATLGGSGAGKADPDPLHRPEGAAGGAGFPQYRQGDHGLDVD